MTAPAHDRARASEHAILLTRSLHVPLRDLAALMPHLPAKLAGKLSLTLPGRRGAPRSLPVRLALEAFDGKGEWAVRLRCVKPYDGKDFFEGDMAASRVDPNESHVVLRGRFAFPPALLAERVDSGVLHDIADENLGRIFETMLLEVEAEAAASP